MVFVDGSSVSRTLITWYQTLADCQRQRTEDAPRDEVVYRRWSCHCVSRTIIKGRGAYRTTTAMDWSFVDARLPQADLHRCIVRQRCRQCRAYTGWRHKNGWRGAHSGCFKLLVLHGGCCLGAARGRLPIGNRVATTEVTTRAVRSRRERTLVCRS